MRRRDVLRAAPATAVLGPIGGCLGDGPPGGDPPSPGDPPGSDIDGTDFEIIDISSGMETNEATVTADDRTVTVRGTIPGNDGCYTAKLADVSGGRTLRLTIRSRRREMTRTLACTQAIVEIRYRATVMYDGSLPDRVEVVHEAMGASEVVAAVDLDAVG